MPELVFVPRSEWGSSQATEDFIRNRYSVTAKEKTSVHVHHTGAIDVDDNTPNRWDYDEAVAYMRRLQTSRPDLGPLPYNENYAVNEDLSIVWVFEGRGLLKVGAHTAGYNRSGIGLGALGNFDRGDTDGAKAIKYAMERRVAWLRNEQGFTNLGTRKNPNGWNAWGHRDTSTKTCPGHSLYPLLEHFNMDDVDEDMALTPAEEKVVRDMTRALGEVNSNGYFAREAVALIRRERDNPLHKPGSELDEAALRAIIREEIAAAKLTPKAA